MSTGQFKKLAGTSAVFVRADFAGVIPMERDGLEWSAAELHLEEWPEKLNPLSPMQNALALEGLEDYQPPGHGDLREVVSVGASFVYLRRLRGWVQVAG